MILNENRLLRYSRNIILPEIGGEGQEKLLNSKVLAVGAGGLGSPLIMYLAAAGIGHITIMDHDSVDISNLQRQIIHNMDALGKSKVKSAEEFVSRLNPDTKINAINKKIDINFDVDKNLIGGLKIKVDDTLYDSSLQTKLENAKSKLVGV